MKWTIIHERFDGEKRIEVIAAAYNDGEVIIVTWELEYDDEDSPEWYVKHCLINDLHMDETEDSDFDEQNIPREPPLKD